jgi:hypothetical protein
MSRGYPHIVGGLIGGAFTLTGGYLYTVETPAPSAIGLPLTLFGLLVIITGWYVHRTSPAPIDLGTSEEVLMTVEPNQLVSTIRLSIGCLILLVAGYLLFGTQVPYVYPTLTFVIGFAVLLAGLVRYWKNTLTTHYVTTQRVVSEYRFISLDRQIMQIDDIIGVNHRQSLVESLVGYGSVLISSGGGNPSASQIVFSNVANPGEAVSGLQNAQENYS